jgi:hypothetical protein
MKEGTAEERLWNGTILNSLSCQQLVAFLPERVFII